MSILEGRQITFGLTKETVRNTAETTASKWFPHKTFSIQRLQEYLNNDSAIGNLHKDVKQDLEFENVGGNMESKLDELIAGDMLYYLFGDVTSTQVGATTVYEHEFTLPSDVATPSFTTFTNLPATGDIRLSGCRVASIDFTAEAGADSMMNSSVMGIAQASASAQTPSFSEPNILQSRHCTIGYADTVAGLSAPTFLDIRSASINLNNNLAPDKALGNLNPVDMLSGGFNFEFKFSALVKADIFETWQAGAVEKAFIMKWEDTGRDLDSGNYPAVQFEIAPSKLVTTFNMPIDDKVMVDITVTPQFGFASGLGVRAKVTNTVTAY